MRNVIRLSIALLVAAAAILAFTVKLRSTSTAKISKQDSLVVHEWGTFTSIAGKDGVALEWRPLNGSSDLPKFVHTMDKPGLGLRHQTKADLTALVRMETPVLYFYPNQEMNISAEVGFPKGKITEWYPHARTVGAGINWGILKVTPGAALNLPADYSENHYYAARETDAALVQVCASNGKVAEQEKFLFYRGVGNFDLPLSVKFQNGQVTLRNSGKEQIARAIIFESHNGKIGYRAIDNLTGEVITERLALDSNIDAVIYELQQTLVTSGLYEKEAEAMIKTWRNSWFEEGMRVFYLLPRTNTDMVLPLTIQPTPTQVVRVLVGRTEVITPEMEKSVRDKVSLLSSPSSKVREEARIAIQKCGRFSEPILKRIMEGEKDPVVRTRIEQTIQTVTSHSDKRIVKS